MPLQKRSMWWSWKDVTLDEMKAFIGVIINMGMNAKPEIDDYFSTDWVDYQPFFKDFFSRERFLQIFWNLHLSPPPNGPRLGTLTRFGKVRNVVLYLDKEFREYYVPKNKVSVDESTIGYKGKILFKVYNKDKPTKWGIKVFVLSESSSGYICALEPYFGKSNTDRMERQDLGVTSRVVLHLVNKLRYDYGSEGLHVFTDRFYTNVDLAEALYEMKVHITGTIMRQRKGLPEQVRPKRKSKSKNARKGKKNQKQKKEVPKLELKRGDIKAFRKDDKYNLLLWRDTNLVVMLSSLYDTSVETIRRVKKRGKIEEIKKPRVVCEYNQSMGGVDIADQYISSYSFTRKSIKWWRKVFFWLLETAIVNAYLLYNMDKCQGKMRQRKFRKELIKELVGNVRNVKKKTI
ncbi:piggyBac transposable element-derived protein 4-like [Macrosteles quadrilineatus]|uniref:piggyBac transposable element-derived protein 4-like n=1 Tax=Macrosteles quadrilineatus TaxID=74068 RepID=UPI0023E1DF21|nr:piggyBac transposable element-derived protein 4-like [Macrosteles quadrilineatus]